MQERDETLYVSVALGFLLLVTVLFFAIDTQLACREKTNSIADILDVIHVSLSIRSSLHSWLGNRSLDGVWGFNSRETNRFEEKSIVRTWSGYILCTSFCVWFFRSCVGFECTKIDIRSSVYSVVLIQTVYIPEIQPYARRTKEQR